MLVSRLHGVRDLRTEEVPDPVTGPEDVKLRVAYNGICGTDLRYYFTQGPITDGPQILGHEFSGTVVEVGSNVSHVGVGARVCVRPMTHCGRCSACLAGLTNLCSGPEGGSFGCGGDGGGLAEFARMPSELVFPLPDAMSLEQGALIEPFSVAYNGVLRSGAEPGATVVVLGGGPIGIGVVLGLRATGITDVTVVEPSAVRRQVLADLGTTQVLDPTVDDVRGTVMAATDDKGVDIVIVCASPPDVLLTALRLVRPRGRVVVIATFVGTVDFSPSDLIRWECEVVGSRGYIPGVYERVIELVHAGHYPTHGWVEHIAWDDVVEAGLEPLRRGERMKLLVDIAPTD